MNPPINTQYFALAAFKAICWGAAGLLIDAKGKPETCAVILMIASITKTALSYLAGLASSTPIEYHRLNTCSTLLTDLISVFAMDRFEAINDAAAGALRWIAIFKSYWTYNYPNMFE